jgi:hypothetical protein
MTEHLDATRFQTSLEQCMEAALKEQKLGLCLRGRRRERVGMRGALEPNKILTGRKVIGAIDEII